MEKYHISSNGNISICRAKTLPCPLGGGHFDTKKEAESYLENKYSNIDEYNMNVTLGIPYNSINASRRGLFVKAQTEQAIDDGMETSQLYCDEDGVWSRERAKLHEEMILEVMEKYKNVPSNNKVVFSGGLPGAGKTTVLTKYENFNVNDWATVSSDDFKELLAERDMIPKIEGLTPMESSTLVHEESSYLADKLLEELGKRGKNIIYDFTCKSEHSTIRRMDKLKKYNYKTKDMQFIFVDISINVAKERAKFRYKEGLNEGVMGEHRNAELALEGRFDEQMAIIGGRYLPEDIIEQSKPTNENYSSVNAETLVNLHTNVDLGLPKPIIYNNSGSQPVKTDYNDFLGGKV